ncbi:MAG TPA: MFS transporter [Chloroflexota bacterium]|jgi:MFS family permease|nr:MFS transporter [Chloroflexota bacterium]
MTPDSAPKRQAFSLWRNRDYLILWSGQAVSALGSGVSEIALPLLVLAITHSPIQAGIVAALGGLPYPLLGIPAGVLVDRWDRKRVMIVCDSANALAMVSIAVAVVIGRVSIAQFYVVALITGTAYVFFSLAEIAAIPSIVPADQLPTARAQNQAVGNGTAVISQPIGGALFQVARGVPFHSSSFLLATPRW